jgi:hypothetical protein
MVWPCLPPRSRSSAKLTPLHSWGKYRRKNALATINNRERHKLKIGNNLGKI